MGKQVNESFNGRLRDVFFNGELFHTLTEARGLIEDWRKYYKNVRPHSSLGYRPPALEAVVIHDPHSTTLHADHGLQDSGSTDGKKAGNY